MVDKDAYDNNMRYSIYTASNNEATCSMDCAERRIVETESDNRGMA